VRLISFCLPISVLQASACPRLYAFNAMGDEGSQLNPKISDYALTDFDEARSFAQCAPVAQRAHLNIQDSCGFAFVHEIAGT
jgi:hypothetical protein